MNDILTVLKYNAVRKVMPRALVPISLLSLVAFLLRAFRLEQQSFWYDEAFSVYLARFDLAMITARTAADIQPPLYYYLLHFWMLVAGDSEFAVRFLSLGFGVLTVPLMYVVARRLFDSGAGFWVACIAALAPLYLWYSQEARMYTLITFLGLWSSYALLRALSADWKSASPKIVSQEPTAGTKMNRWHRWIVFVIANIAAVYTHYFAFTLIAFQFLYVGWQIAVRNRQPATDNRPSAIRHPLLTRLSATYPLLAFLAIFIAFLPWAPFMLNRLGEDASYWHGDLKWGEAIRHIFITFATGESVLEELAQYIAAVWLVVLLLGLIAHIVHRYTSRAPIRDPQSASSPLLFAALYLVIPLALLLFLFSRNPKFNARYLMLASPGLYLLLGAGLAAWWRLAFAARRRRVVAGIAWLGTCGSLLLTALYANANAYWDPAFTKADFRGVAQYIAAHAREDEAIILTSGHLFPAFDYYFKEANLPELRLPDEPTLNAENVVTYAAANELNRALVGKRGVWVVLWQDEVADPNGFVPMLLSTRGTEVPVPASFWQLRLRHWMLPENFAPFAAAPEIEHPQEANFKNKFKLLGWSQPTPLPADQGASLRLYWQALEPTDQDYHVAIRIVDAQGIFWGKVDRRPAGYNYPTMRWKPGQALFGDYVATLLPGTPPGEYYATVTLFTQDDQTGLDVLASNGAPIGKSVKVGPLRVLPAARQPTLVDLKIQHTLSVAAPPFTLLGYNLGREQGSTGEAVPLTLFWRTDAKPDADYFFQILFGDRWSAPLPLANAAHPTTRWTVGEIVRGQHLVQIPPEARARRDALTLRLVGGRQEQNIDLQQSFVVEQVRRIFDPPRPQFAQAANFYNLIQLVGFDLSAQVAKRGEPFTVTLYWQAMGTMDKSYTVFVHLLDRNNQVKAQRDAQPLNGARQTQTWVKGEYLTDAYPLEIKADTPPGEYRIEIGWYDAGDPTFKRLQVMDTNGNPVGDNVILKQSVVVE